ncbi:MAG TPA: capsular biosynthesis protein [Lachnospiraceae bacterium]|nr:capsular biosynthesis protein [Lachnospiraceae bacterium]
MNIDDLRDKYNRAGGTQILKQYARAHVLCFALLQTALQGTSQKSLEIVRLSVNNKILGRLRNEYSWYIDGYLLKQSLKPDKASRRSKDIWILWLDGMERAPKVVQKCCRSVRDSFPDRPIHILTEDNYRDYARFPGFIQEKIDSGAISKTHLSDLLRLELLIKYGGTWLDATVFCSSGEVPDYMMDSDLFLFQDLKPGLDGHCQRISSWMITACTNHPILRLTRALLYEYWLMHDEMVDYFLFHDFFELAIEAYPEEWSKVVPCSNAAPHILLLRLFEPYREEVWEAVKEMTPFHKLSYKFDAEKAQYPDTYYKKVLGENQ